MEVKIAKYAGYCFGVKRAISLAEKSLSDQTKKVYTLGHIIHNPGVVNRLDKKGIQALSSEKDIPQHSTLVIRSHGVCPATINRIKQKKIHIVDATCPYVKNAQKKARLLGSEGYFVILIGRKDHPEVIGIKGQVDPQNIMVAEKTADLKAAADKKRVGMLIQTTQTLEKLKEMVDQVLETANEVKIFNTICITTKERQNEAVKLARKVDVMVVVGGKNSANTTHLADISRQENKQTHHVQNCKEIKPQWFKKASTVGLSGGASTPYTDIVAVKQHIEAMQ